MLKLLSNMAGLFLIFVVGMVLVGGMQVKSFWSGKWDAVVAWVEKHEGTAASFPENIGLPEQKVVKDDTPAPGQDPGTRHGRTMGPGKAADGEDDQQTDAEPQQAEAPGLGSEQTNGTDDPPLQASPNFPTAIVEKEDVPVQMIPADEVTGIQSPSDFDSAHEVIKKDDREQPDMEASPPVSKFTESEKRQFMAEGSMFGERALRALNDIDTRLGRN